MRRLIPLVFLLSLFYSFPVVSQAASPIEGVWRHSEKSAWIEFTFQDGTGTASILRHKENTGAEGLLILIDIEPDDSTSSRWRGKVYAADVDDFVEATLTLSTENSLIIETVDNEGEQVEVLRLLREESTESKTSNMQTKNRATE